MAKPHRESFLTGGDPNWYKDAILYEIHVRAFHDSDNDGVGDFRGLTEKLDYLQDLGVTAVWILPFYPSPLRDDGYDISDYTSVHPSYGTLSDFRHFLREAHRRGIRVVTELVLNHTSDQHPWFQRARRSPPGSKWRDFYVWNDSPEKFRDARIIFKDFESSNWAWDPVAGAYYWHRFYSHQPDLNFDNPEVRKAVFHVLDFWLEMGVDGLRLDAVPYLFEREGTNCENLPETHRMLKALRKRIDGKFPNRMLLAEANQWPEDAADYFGAGDECHMAFHFPLMPRLFMATRMEDRYPILDILDQTPSIPDSCQWALFLRNHDELTLEMVTDEERDYMYRVYAHDAQARINLGIRRRLLPLLGKDRRRYELMNALLFSLPGTPVIYYGDEIGMGDNIYLGDRNGVRTPMQWSADRNAGFSRAPSQKLFLPVISDPDFHYEVVNVEVRQNNTHSLLWWMKRLISLRKRYRAFGRGSIGFLRPDNHRVLAFTRTFGEEQILVVANLSRFAQYVELDLSHLAGKVPVELFGQAEFPPIREAPYLLTLGPHAFYWFSIQSPSRPGGEAVAGAQELPLPSLRVDGGWTELLGKGNRDALEGIVVPFLEGRRWFGGKARRIKSATLRDSIPLSASSSGTRLAIIRVEYVEGEPEGYLLPLAYATGERAQQLLQEAPRAALCRLETRGRSGAEDGVLFDALFDRETAQILLDGIGRRRRFRGESGELAGIPGLAFRHLRGPHDSPLPGAPLRAEQSNTSLLYGDRLVLKLFRRLEAGVNPDLEIGAFLSDKASFPHVPPFAGSLEYREERKAPMTVGILQGFVPNRGDAWSYTMESLGRFFEQVQEAHEPPPPLPVSPVSLLDLAEAEPPHPVGDWIGSYLLSAKQLGERTAQMHIALASRTDDPVFAPEPFTAMYQRSLYQSMRNLVGNTFLLLRKRVRSFPEACREEGRRVLELESAILSRFRSILDRKLTALRIRVHGDLHLGQLLYTGKDFVVLDFEGEPTRPIATRRIKRSPLRDVAGMLRSFRYASSALLIDKVPGGGVIAGDTAVLEPWARCWNRCVSGAYLGAYLDGAAREPFLPRSREELSTMLDMYLLEKAVYELSYEMNNRPDWVRLPLRGILDIMEGDR